MTKVTVDKALVEQALDAIVLNWRSDEGNAVKPLLRAALAEPKAELSNLGTDWTPCRKLPVIVHVREQRSGELYVSTREGITPVKPDDLIMRGVSGEEYPIGRAIFDKTYTLDLSQPVKEPAFWMNEFGQMCATRGFAERSWPGQKLTPLYTSPPQPADANDDLLLFAALVATHERERCAALVASWNTAMTDKLAREIRASADHPTTNERE